MVLEDWADEAIVPNARKVMIGAFKQHPNFRTSLLPSDGTGCTAESGRSGARRSVESGGHWSRLWSR
jgi:hypothetical protein